MIIIGKSYGDIAKTVKLAGSTVHTIIKNFNLTNLTNNKPRSGRHKKISPRDIRTIVRKVALNPKISALKLSDRVRKEIIRRVLRSKGFHGRVSRKKLLIFQQNRRNRLEFVNEY
ncbi:uncharacterized protein [Euwallacea similis]|uniref:uncharacterized protein n=1 Tax=Euwallacea similis TaxID=1736056 RepID=UPI00344BC992